MSGSNSEAGLLGSGFEPVSGNIFFHPGDNPASIRSRTGPSRHDARHSRPNNPDLIILCTWMGGSTTRRIAKYTAGYRQLYPRTPVLLVRALFADMAVKSSSAVRASLAPARAVIRGVLGQGHDRGQGIIVHAMSHGGCNTAIQLAESLREEQQKAGRRNLSSKMPKTVFFTSSHPDNRLLLILDCCPGYLSFQAHYSAAIASLPPSWAQNPTSPFGLLGRAALLPLVGSVHVLQTLSIIPGTTDLRRQLHDSSLFGPAPEDASRSQPPLQRLYLYSAADHLVEPHAVEDHAAEARDKVGYRAHAIRFETAMHCALPVENEARYWDAVRQGWWESSSGPDAIVDDEEVERKPGGNEGGVSGEEKVNESAGAVEGAGGPTSVSPHPQGEEVGASDAAANSQGGTVSASTSNPKSKL